MVFSIVALFILVCLMAVGWWKETNLTKEITEFNEKLKCDIRTLEQDKQDVIDYVNSLSDKTQVQDDGTTD